MDGKKIFAKDATNTLFPKYTNSSHSSIKTEQNKQNNHSKSEQKV